MDTNHTDFSLINWDSLIQQLTATAARWFAEEKCFGEEAVLPATGKSAVDLVRDAITTFIKGEIDWEPTSVETMNKELLALLRHVVRNDFLDLVKDRRAYKRTDVLDIYKDENATGDNKNRALTIEDLPAPISDGFHSLEAAIIKRRIFPLLENDRDLEEYVDAVLRKGASKREDIATLLNISPQEVTNRQRRIRLKLMSWKQDVEKSMHTKSML